MKKYFEFDKDCSENNIFGEINILAKIIATKKTDLIIKSSQYSDKIDIFEFDR